MVRGVLQDSSSPCLPPGQNVLTPGPENAISGIGDQGGGHHPPYPGTAPASAPGAAPALALHRSLIWGRF